MEPPNGATVHHVPDARPDGTKTAPYDGSVSGNPPALDIVYVVEGTPVHRPYPAWDTIQERWQRTTPSLWQREYTPSNPPTVPPSGTYKVWDGGILRETGTYTR